MFLFDTNFLIALGDAVHVHHDEAQSFFTLKKQDGWAKSPFTENAFPASSAIPIIPKAQVPHRPPEPSYKNSSANLDTNLGTIPFRSTTRENSQRYPPQKISLTTTCSPSRSKIAENSSLSTKESTQVYCKAAFPPIMLFKTILESKKPVNLLIRLLKMAAQFLFCKS